MRARIIRSLPAVALVAAVNSLLILWHTATLKATNPCSGMPATLITSLGGRPE